MNKNNNNSKEINKELEEEIKQNGRDEMNLAEFAITTLQYQAPKDIKTYTRIDYGVDEYGRKVKREWKISGNDEFGLPGFFAEDLIIALLEITKEQNNFSNREVFTSIKHILEIMHLPNTKYYRDKVVENMNCLTGITIYCKQSFWDNKEKHYKDMAFGIINGFGFRDKNPGRKSKHKDIDTYEHFYWDEDLFNESFKKNNLKLLSTNFYYSLNYPLTKRIYRFLDKRRYSKIEIHLPLEIYAHKLGMSKTYNSFEIKRYLDRAHQELKDSKFLKSWGYYQNKNGDWWVVYYLYEKNELKPLTDQKVLPPEKELHPLAIELIKRNVSEAVATRLVEQYPKETKLQIEHYDYLISKGKLIESAGWFVRAIPENWMLPVNFKSSAQLKEEQIVKQKRSEVEQAKREEEQRKWQEDQKKELVNRKTKYNSLQYDNLWEQVKTELLNNGVPQQSILTWFEPSFICNIENNVITINLPNQFMVEWHTKHYRDQLKKILLKVTENTNEIKYTIN